ncbi:MAG: HEAT repeat domain-containing protein [Acidobacteria bacterium]|nr:HEAT repeat domain-containing protein [Acidobacteriota bacterium]
MRTSFQTSPSRLRRLTHPRQLPLLLLLLLLCVSLRASPPRRPFADSYSKHQAERQRTYDLQHILLQLRLDEQNRSVAGTSTLVLQPLQSGLKQIEVDSAELQIQSVRTEQGAPLAFEQRVEKLLIHLPQPTDSDELVTVTIAYEGRPRKGLYFLGPDSANPHKAAQIWSQGQVEDSHYWFPVYDYPNDKATSEGFYTVNADLTVISNGRLLGVEQGPAAHTQTYHWRQDVPHSTYLISVVAGRFEKYTDSAGEVPLEYYVPVGTGQTKALRTFGETPRVMRFLAEQIGHPYPYAKYSQVAVQDFMLGGMENISATTLTDRALHEQASEPQANSMDLVAHELAHQWFGNLVTVSDWAHIWLHEGFASFWAALYREHRLGKEEYQYSLYKSRRRFLEEDRERYRRPLVTSFYADPFDLFDRTTYEKGALVLDMLRFVLGEERFVVALQHYVSKHRQENVVTEDFQQAVEEASGEDLDWFFDQWVYKAGYPELEVSQQWDESRRVVRLTVEQKQALDSMTPLYRMPVEVEFTTREWKKTFRMEFSQARQEFEFSLPSLPEMIRFDPEDRVLKTLKFPKAVSELVYQLENDPSVPGRIWASEQLAQAGDKPDVVTALEQRLVNDPFWGVKVAATDALGQIRTKEARSALAKGLPDKDAHVRQACARALGSFFKDSQAAALAENVYQTDSNPITAGEALEAIGKIKSDSARAVLQKALERDSDGDVIRRSALAGLRELGDKKALEVAIYWAQYGQHTATRMAAIEALARLGKGEEKVADQLISLLDDPDSLVRFRVVTVLSEGNFAKAVPALSQSARSEVDSRVRRAAQQALERFGIPTQPKRARDSAQKMPLRLLPSLPDRAYFPL